MRNGCCPGVPPLDPNSRPRRGQPGSLHFWTVPDEMPVGEHEVTITVTDRSSKIGRPLDPSDLPTHDMGPWPKGLSLRGEDVYDDGGR
jgi:hypothetical protein